MQRMILYFTLLLVCAGVCLAANNPLGDAIADNDLEKIETMIQADPTMVSQTFDGTHELPLVRAVRMNKPEVIALLLRYKADPTGDAQSFTPLHHAVTYPHPDIVKMLLDAGADVHAAAKGRFGYTPLHVAVTKENIQLLLRAGADLEAKSHNDETPLYAAAYAGHLEAVAALLDAGANCNVLSDYYHITPLDAAIMQKHLDVVNLLLARGADIMLTGSDKRTAIHLLCAVGMRAQLENILPKVADINITDRNGLTPLHTAALAGQAEIVTLLLAHQADVKARATMFYYQQTPLHLAKNVATVKALLAGGADSMPRRSRGSLPCIWRQKLATWR